MRNFSIYSLHTLALTLLLACASCQTRTIGPWSIGFEGGSPDLESTAAKEILATPIRTNDISLLAAYSYLTSEKGKRVPDAHKKKREVRANMTGAPRPELIFELTAGAERYNQEVRSCLDRAKRKASDLQAMSEGDVSRRYHSKFLQELQDIIKNIENRIGIRGRILLRDKPYHNRDLTQYHLLTNELTRLHEAMLLEKHKFLETGYASKVSN